MQILGWRLSPGANVSADGYYDWISNNGDRHYDVVTAKLLRRKGVPPIVLLVVGPLMLSCVVERVAAPKVAA